MKKLLAAIGFSILAGLSGCCTSTPVRPLERIVAEQKDDQKKKGEEYQTTYSESGFTVKRKDGVYFRCNQKDCSLNLGEIEFVNENFHDTDSPIVDRMNISGFSKNFRYSIDHIPEPGYKKYVAERYRKADEIYQQEAKRFEINKRYQQWLNRPDVLDNYLK